MILAHGGIEGGYGLYLSEGKPAFVYNYLGARAHHVRVQGNAAQGEGDHRGRFRLRRGRHRKRRLAHGDGQWEEGRRRRLERSVPIKFSIGEGLDIGMDGGSAVDFVYQLPFEFGGTIEKVTFELKPKPADTKPAEDQESGRRALMTDS
jgi:arylsulfatase